MIPSEKPRGPLFWIIALIAGATLISGIVQLLKPHFVLKLVGGPSADPVPYFFSIIGMFMGIFGAMMLAALFDPDDHPIIVLWASVQKLGACAAVAMGVLHQTFGELTLVVAGFDLLSGILMLMYGRTLRPRAGVRV